VPKRQAGGFEKRPPQYAAVELDGSHIELRTGLGEHQKG
jgi:hypothetical protein